MRNSKVRARIAAGKLKLRVRDLRNLGARSEQMLAQIGVHSAQELRRRGPVRTFFELKRAGVTSSINMLWALAGALEPWPEALHQPTHPRLSVVRVRDVREVAVVGKELERQHRTPIRCDPVERDTEIVDLVAEPAREQKALNPEARQNLRQLQRMAEAVGKVTRR